MHSLNDRLSKELKVDFYSCNEYIPLQALRNLCHHETEFTHEVRVLPVGEMPAISTDLLFLCLVSRTLVERSIEKIPANRRQADREVIEKTLMWYGQVVNINPCIFNFSVRVFEKLKEVSVTLEGKEFVKFTESYDFETLNGHSHLVSGEISCRLSDIDLVLAKAFGNVA